MTCEICGETEGMHNPRCPKYEPPKFVAICDVCGQEIYEGDEYIENDHGECIHFGCEKNLRWLLDWLGCGVKKMEDNL